MRDDAYASMQHAMREDFRVQLYLCEWSDVPRWKESELILFIFVTLQCISPGCNSCVIFGINLPGLEEPERENPHQAFLLQVQRIDRQICCAYGHRTREERTL